MARQHIRIQEMSQGKPLTHSIPAIPVIPPVTFPVIGAAISPIAVGLPPNRLIISEIFFTCPSSTTAAGINTKMGAACYPGFFVNLPCILPAH